MTAEQPRITLDPKVLAGKPVIHSVEAGNDNHDEEPAEADDGADDATVEEGSN